MLLRTSYYDVASGSGVVPEDIVGRKVTDNTPDRPSRDVMLDKVLGIPVNSESGHFLFRNPDSSDRRFLELLLDVKPEHVEGGGVTIEDGQVQEFAFLVLRNHLLDQSREISAVADPADTFAAHVQDTLIAGAGLCDEKVVRRIVSEAPAGNSGAIERLACSANAKGFDSAAGRGSTQSSPSDWS